MKIGVVYPQNEIETDSGAVRAFTQAADELGFTHVLAYDHVLGANRNRAGGFSGPYDHTDPFHSPLLLFAYMAALSTRLEFVTGILILPQRDTVLAAKQAATLSVLSDGRFRLGVGVGWNAVEYVAQGQEFHTRGKRTEAQIPLLRRLWSEPLLSVDDGWHTIEDAGINPLPGEQAIPIWFGGHHDRVLQRIARMGDGWFPQHNSAQEAAPLLAKLDGYLAAAGRTRQDIGIEAHIRTGHSSAEEWPRLAEEWQAAGATHLCFHTMRDNRTRLDQHLAAMQEFSGAMKLTER